MNTQTKDFIRLKVFREVGKMAEDMTLPALEELESAGLLPGAEAKHEIIIRATIWSKTGRFGIDVRPRQTRTTTMAPPPRHALLDVARPSLPGISGEEDDPRHGPPTGRYAGVNPRVWKPQAALCRLCARPYIMHTGNQEHCPDCITRLGHRPGAVRDAIKEQIRTENADRLKLVAQLTAKEKEAA